MNTSLKSIKEMAASPFAACIWLGAMNLVLIGLIAAVLSLSPKNRFVNCSMANFHPDFSSKTRQMCRSARESQITNTHFSSSSGAPL
jgi:hypothetical protein